MVGSGGDASPTPATRVATKSPAAQSTRKTKARWKRRQATGGSFTAITQNVRGLAKASGSLSTWFSGFRRRTQAMQADVVFLQETRATEAWATRLSDRHAREWGLRPEQLEHSISFWHATPTAAGGVAILLKPHGVISEPTPLWQHLWSPWFLAVQAKMNGDPVTLINVYGPSSKHRAREELFTSLTACPRPAGTLLLGGDFNCTLDCELDRSRSTSSATDSPALHRLLEHWALVDVAAEEMQAVVTDADKLDFYARHHTYRYRLGDGTMCSSRLDRWYVSTERSAHVSNVRVETPVNYSDHDALSLTYTVRLRRPARSRRRRPRLRYPLPFGCRDTISRLTEAAVTEFSTLSVDADGALSAHAWDKLKTKIRRGALSAIHKSRQKQRRSMKQRARRLNAALKAALQAASPKSDRCVASVDGITAGVEDLSVDPYATVSGLRRAIIRLDRRRSRARRASTFAKYASGTPESERAFFHRFRARQGHRGPIDLSTPTPEGTSVADRLAEDWSSVTQRGATPPSARDNFFRSLPEPRLDKTLVDLDRDFTEAEVRAALDACPRGKAPGPDGLPNDWYRDHGDLLVPVLTPLFNQWHHQRTLPASFRMATVACIAKTSAPSTGLDFRPIALLDTDYKIYARLLLNRLSPRLPELVSPTQFGFVTGRQVHDALDVFHGIQRMVRDGDVPPTALAVLLDFAKAYDTLDRTFLLRTLRRLGFPPRFLGAVEQMHLHTTAEYAADDISESQTILNGIRQGCPLAPTLFVLAVDTLYDAISVAPGVTGIHLPDGNDVCATGYADDTTCYLLNSNGVPPLRAVLDSFGDASGLHVIVGKCLAVFLGESGAASAASPCAFPVANPDMAARLLGGHVATQDVSTQAWSIALQQVRARLHWAELKTTNELQRVKLLRAVLLPKFLFVARHQWPSAAVIEKFQCLIDDFVWGGSLAADGNRRRAWMSSTAARAHVSDGGLNVPHLTHELQAMSVATIERWSQPRVGAPEAVCRALLHGRGVEDGILAPTRRPAPTQLSLQPTLRATGYQVRRSLAATPRTQPELALLLPLLQHVGRGTSADFGWDNGWLSCDYSRVQQLLEPLRQWQATAYGNLQVHSLLQGRLVGEELLLLQHGKAALTADFAGLFHAHDRLQDVLEIAWEVSGRIRFRALRHQAPLAPLLSVQFRRLCDAIVFNYPGILRPPAQPEDLVLRPPTLDVWRLRPAAQGFTLEWSPVEGAQIDLGIVSSTAEATVAARRALRDSTCAFERHGWLDAPFALWAGIRAPSATTAHRLLAVANNQRHEVEREARRRRWERTDATIAEALDTVDWKELLVTPGAPSAHRLLFHKVKGDRLSGWDRVFEKRGCPHCPAIGSDGGSAFHIVWACPKAQLRWQQLLDYWAPLYTECRSLHATNTKRDVFGLRLQTLPDHLWHLPELTRLGVPSARDTVATGRALVGVWRRQVLATLHTIWRWRTTPDTEDEIWTEVYARASHRAQLDAISHAPQWTRTADSAATKFTGAALDTLFAGIGSEKPPPVPLAATGCSYLLFFDGGARRNPGAGGSGAVIVRVDASATGADVIWTAAMSSTSPKTTNNQAEYSGLLFGLTEAHRQQWTPLEVVGDSHLVLRQMATYNPPKTAKLLEIYAPARRLADSLGVRKWNHHRREYNRMADAAANVAMDKAASSQVTHPTTRDEHAYIATLLAHDFAHWRVGHLANAR